MSAICSQVLGSNIRAAVLPNLDCGDTAPVQQVINTVAIALNDRTATIGLDPAYIAGGYTASTSLPLYKGTILFFGTTAIEVTETTNITTTPAAVAIKAAPAAVAINGTASSVLAAILCTSGFNISAPPQTATNSTTCTGNLLTDVNTGYKRMATIQGFPDRNDQAYWNILEKVGKELGSVYYLVDYNGQYSENGVMQLSYPDKQQGNVAQIQTYQIQGQVQSFEVQAGSSILTPTQLTAVNALRRLYGFTAAK
jgi:hypothetical protein